MKKNYQSPLMIKMVFNGLEDILNTSGGVTSATDENYNGVTVGFGEFFLS